MIPNIGPMEIAIVLIIALVVFGPKRIPELGSSLGKGIRGFGKELKGDEEDGARPELTRTGVEEPTVVASAKEKV